MHYFAPFLNISSEFLWLFLLFSSFLQGNSLFSFVLYFYHWHTHRQNWRLWLKEELVYFASWLRRSHGGKKLWSWSHLLEVIKRRDKHWCPICFPPFIQFGDYKGFLSQTHALNCLQIFKTILSPITLAINLTYHRRV